MENEKDKTPQESFIIAYPADSDLETTLTFLLMLAKNLTQPCHMVWEEQIVRAIPTMDIDMLRREAADNTYQSNLEPVTKRLLLELIHDTYDLQKLMSDLKDLTRDGIDGKMHKLHILTGELSLTANSIENNERIFGMTVKFYDLRLDYRGKS